MKIIGKTGTDELAWVYLAKTDSGKYMEFVESIQPMYSRDEKWVLIVSTLFGCPVGCAICDAGGWYEGKLSVGEILEQIDFLVKARYPDRVIPAQKFKVQFARMGDPSFNMNVLDVLEKLPDKYNAPGLMPCISTVAPKGTDDFFEGLIRIKNSLYSDSHFQMQFSIHTTDESIRDSLIPIKKWDFKKIASFGEKFYVGGQRKIALNFALAENAPIDIDILLKYFDPAIFIVKLTPVNPTVNSRKNDIKNRLCESNKNSVERLVLSLREHYEVIVSIGEIEENSIGSNCGQYVRYFLEKQKSDKDMTKFEAYDYKVISC